MRMEGTHRSFLVSSTCVCFGLCWAYSRCLKQCDLHRMEGGKDGVKIKLQDKDHCSNGDKVVLD